MKRFVRILLPILVLAGVGLAFWYAVRQREKPLPANQIAANGTIETTEVDVTSRIPGRLTQVIQHEGNEVPAHELMATLDPSDLQTQVSQAQHAYQVADANLKELLAGHAPEDIARARAAEQAARDAQHQAQARLDLLRAGTREEQIKQLQAAVEQAQVTLNNAETELRRAESLLAQGAVPASRWTPRAPSEMWRRPPWRRRGSGWRRRRTGRGRRTCGKRRRRWRKRARR